MLRRHSKIRPSLILLQPRLQQPAEAAAAPPRPEPSYAALDSLRALKHQIRIQRELLDIATAEETQAADRLERERLLAEESRDGNVADMAKVYSNMKPQSAAQVMAYLDDKTFKLVFDQISTRQAAKIMAFVDPARIARLTKQAAVSRAGQ